MSNLVLLLACLAGAGDGRRVQSLMQQLIRKRTQLQNAESGPPFNPQEAIAMLLLSSTAESAFTASNFRKHSAVHNPTPATSRPTRQGSHIPIVMSDEEGTATDGAVKTEEAPEIDWSPVVGHMNEDHADSIIAYCEFFGGLSDVRNAVLTDMNMEGFFVNAELGDGSKQDIMIPYEGGPLKDMRGMGKAVKVMSMKARDEVFVKAASGVTEKVGFAPFNNKNALFKDKCADGNFTDLADSYASDAILVPQFPGPPPANAPLLFGKDAIQKFLEEQGPMLLKGLTLKPMRLLQKSDTEVTEIGRAWGLPGRSYSRQWQNIDGKWLLKHDYLPVMPPAATS